MHVPNGFLTDPVCAATALGATAALGYGFSRLRQQDNSRICALMAATGAGIFAAQMVNFPIAQGTSGHVLGAALAAIVLGPWCGMITMAIVLAVQCLAFGDGGLNSLGANVLNMAVVGVLVAAGLNHLVTRRVAGVNGRLAGAAVAALGSVLASATLCAAELAASGTYQASDVFSAMLSAHLGIAVVETFFTVALVAASIAIARRTGPLTSGQILAAGLLAALAVTGLLAPLASSAPDGLERVALDLNFADLAADSWALAPDYTAPGIAWPALAAALAGIGGAVLVCISSYTVGRAALVKVRRR